MHGLLASLALIVLLVAGASGVLGAEPPPERDLEREIAAGDGRRETRVVGLCRMRLSYPQRLSGGLGAMVVRQPVDYDCKTVCEYRGLTLQAEPGISGGQLSLGWAVLTAEKGRNAFFLSDVFLGYGVRAALLRTWGGADLDPPVQTLLGAEAAFTVIRFSFSLGAFRRIDAGDTDDPWVITGGMGWGF